MMVQSFGRPRTENTEVVGEEPVPFPVIHLPVVPIIDRAAVDALGEIISARVADAVRAGFAEGLSDVTADLAAEDEPDDGAECADTDAAGTDR